MGYPLALAIWISRPWDDLCNFSLLPIGWLAAHIVGITILSPLKDDDHYPMETTILHLEPVDQYSAYYASMATGHSDSCEPKRTFHLMRNRHHVHISAASPCMLRKRNTDVLKCFQVTHLASHCPSCLCQFTSRRRS